MMNNEKHKALSAVHCTACRPLAQNGPSSADMVGVAVWKGKSVPGLVSWPESRARTGGARHVTAMGRAK